MQLDRIRGCLFGGAIGDALGYTVEFWQEDMIFQKYGSNGITEYELTDGKALISDDTQMTLFTATGILEGDKKRVSYSWSKHPCLCFGCVSVLAAYPDF